MKHTIFSCATILALCMVSIPVIAQLKVANTGKVGVAIADTIEPQSVLSIGGQGQTNAKAYVYKGDTITNVQYQYGIYSHVNMPDQSSKIYAVVGKCTNIASFMTGVYGDATARSHIGFTPDGGMFRPTTAGVYGTAGGADYENFGVYGTLNNNVTAGAGIFGTINGTDGMLLERYAGYFNGKTKVKGDFYAFTLNTYITPFLMTNIGGTARELPQKLLSLNPIQYQINDSVLESQHVHYGFDAKEMQKLFPELVQEDSIGNVSVNYVELIPLLVQTVQSLSYEIEALKKASQTASVAHHAKAAHHSPYDAVLYQNNPNPFSIDTKISYQLPSSTKRAALYIYDMNGLQIAEYPITVYGENAVIVSARTLDAGMYLYSLIADGQIVDTKRMILTK